jgi:hypothetical protein
VNGFLFTIAVCIFGGRTTCTLYLILSSNILAFDNWRGKNCRYPQDFAYRYTGNIAMKNLNFICIIDEKQNGNLS